MRLRLLPPNHGAARALEVEAEEEVEVVEVASRCLLWLRGCWQWQKFGAAEHEVPMMVLLHHYGGIVDSRCLEISRA